MFGECHDSVPLRRLCDGDDAAFRIEPLVRPEAPADGVGFEQFAERRDPFVGILTRFAHPQGDVVPLAEFEVGCDQFGDDRVPVTVERVGQLVVERRPEHAEVGVPPRPAEEDDVVGIVGADGRDDALVERFQQGV